MIINPFSASDTIVSNLKLILLLSVINFMIELNISSYNNSSLLVIKKLNAGIISCDNVFIHNNN